MLGTPEPGGGARRPSVSVTIEDEDAADDSGPEIGSASSSGSSTYGPASRRGLCGFSAFRKESKAISPTEGVESIQLTFREMERRRRRRAFYGRRTSKGITKSLLDAGFLLVPFTVFTNAVGLNYFLKTGALIPTIITVWLVVLNLWMVFQSPDNVAMEWARTVLYVCVMWFAWVYDPDYHKDCPYWQGWPDDPCLKESEWAIIIVFIVAEGIILLIWMIISVLYPLILDRRCCRAGVRFFWRLRPVPDQKHTYTFRTTGWFSVFRRTCKYQGEVDEAGRPHGYGSWIEDSYHSECLTGLWEHGLPVGPFVSREHGTGAQFRNMRMGWCTGRTEKKLDARAFWPSSQAEVRIGGAAVECSTAGAFLSFLPCVEKEVDDFNGLTDMSRLLEWIDEGKGPTHRASIELNIIDDANTSALRATGDGRRRRSDLERNTTTAALVSPTGTGSAPMMMNKTTSTASHDSKLDRFHSTPTPVSHVPVRLVRGRGYVLASEVPKELAMLHQPKKEALIFIHGLNCSVAEALERLGQVCTLGALPSHIVPIVYSWASGQVLTYFAVLKAIPDSAAGLAPLVQALADEGIERIHLMVHSMGGRVLLAAWETLTKALVQLRKFEEDGLHPNHPDLRSPTDASWVLHTPLNHRTVLGTLTCINVDAPYDAMMEVLPDMVEYAEHVTFYNDANDKALQGAALMNREAIFGRYPEPVACHRGPPNDRITYGAGYIDVIDCTCMEQNVHAVRHNYYCFNVQILEDIVDLVRTAAPARARKGRLVPRDDTNVYAFLCPPAFLRE